MKKIVLLSSAILPFLLTGAFVVQANRAATSSAIRAATAPATVELAEMWNSPTGRQWLQNQPNHWRAVLLNH